MTPSLITVKQLRQQLAALEPAATGGEVAAISTGSLLVDALLPQRGWRPGSLVEWLTPSPGTGAFPLALATARLLWKQGTLVVIDRCREFYPPAAAAWGAPLARTILVRPTNEADQRWAWEQALLSPGVALVWGTLDRMQPRDFRRLQLAAEGGKRIGFMFRSDQMRGEPSWAHVQLFVRPSERSGSELRRTAAEDRWRLSLELTRGRGVAAGGKLELELNQTGIVQEVPPDERAIPMYPVSQLAHSTTCRFSA